MPQEIALVYLKFSGCGVDICLPSRQVFFENSVESVNDTCVKSLDSPLLRFTKHLLQK